MKAPFVAIAAVTLAACGSSTPSKELVNARQAYNQAVQSRAAEYAPDQVASARRALESAERAYADDPGSSEERSRAYVAHRRAQRAMVDADAAYERSQKQRAEEELLSLQEQMNARKQAELEASESRIESLEAQNEKLEEIGKVREDLRGTVLTISGAVLFETGKAELVPAAREALTKVAKATAGGDRPITVEGYTDSRGSDEANKELSQRRAEAVRSFLVQQGVKSERIKAVGMGEEAPVASNDTDEGRASNRRVEIVLGKMTPASGER